jgi:hypothetical protein
VLDALVARGFSVDYLAYGHTQPLLYAAIGNRKTALVEYLVSRGANLDVRGSHPAMTMREMAQQCYASDPESPETQRIFDVCGGGDRDEVLRAYREGRKTQKPGFAIHVRRAIALAEEESVRLGQDAVRADNLFLGMIREDESTVLHLLGTSGVDLERLRASVAERLLPAAASLARLDVAYTPAAASMLQASLDDAVARGRGVVTTADFLRTLAAEPSIAEMLAAVGGSAAQLIDRCRAIQ